MNPRNPTNPGTILLTFDIEDWFQVENLRPLFPPSTWDNQELRAEKNTHKILDLLDSIELSNLNEPNKTSNSIKSNTPKATFFVLGWIAERLPHLAKEIHRRGHEVASHGYSHLMCNQMNSSDLKQDLIRSKHLLEDIIGSEVKGYRAPNFSIDDHTMEMIQNCGYQYDSSYNDFSKHGRYGTVSINKGHEIDTVIKIDNSFSELKISNVHLLGQILPWGGGGYFRLMPPSLFNAGVTHCLTRDNVYVFYLHPWELDPDQPRIKSSPFKTWRHYLNLTKTSSRLQNLIETFGVCDFMPCIRYLSASK